MQSQSTNEKLGLKKVKIKMEYRIEWETRQGQTFKERRNPQKKKPELPSILIVRHNFVSELLFRINYCPIAFLTNIV